MKKEEAIIYLYDFVRLIKSFEKELINSYKLDDHPYQYAGSLFPRIGEQKVNDINVKYKFHGRGCLLEMNDLVIDYNIDPTERDYIIITSFKFLRFLKSKSDLLNLDIEATINLLMTLLESGVLIKSKDANMAFNVSTDWFESFNIDAK